MKRLSISVGDEAYDSLVRKAEAERRSVASTAGMLVERGLGVVGAGAKVGSSVRAKVPVGGQDAAAGKGVEERQEDDEPEVVRLMHNLETSLTAARSEGVSAAEEQRPRSDHVVIGGDGCTHPFRYQLGRKCEAPGCGKVLR